MRGSVIIISRLVDTILKLQGKLTKKVYWEENLAVIFALMAVGVNILGASAGGFEFLTNKIALITFSSYIVAYAIRIYIMNYFKCTRGKGVKQDNKGYYAVEQFSAAFFIFAAALFVFKSPEIFGWVTAEVPSQIFHFREAFLNPMSIWKLAILAGTAFGAVSFFSVFIFMYKGRTATFAGLVNRLTSLIAGTASTVIFCYTCGGRFPALKDWGSLAAIIVAVGFLARAEKKRAAELRAQNLIPASE